MAVGFRRIQAQQLTRAGLVVAPRRSIRRRLAQVLLAALMLIAGAALGYLGRDAVAPTAVPPPPGPSAEAQRLQQQLDETRSALRLARAHGQELELQIDALNQSLRDANVELTFVKKARQDGKP